MIVLHIAYLLCFASVVSAQCTGSLTLKSYTDADSIANCQVYRGSIDIDPSYSGSLSLGDIQEITGDLSGHGASQLTSLTSYSLTTIGGTLNLTNLPALSNIYLETLNQTRNLYLEDLPTLTWFDFNKVLGEVNTIAIRRTNLTGFYATALSQLADIAVEYNENLNVLNLSGLLNVTGSLKVTSNSLEFEIMLDNLQVANNLSFAYVAGVTLPSLTLVKGHMSVVNGFLPGFEAPFLTRVNSSLAFDSTAAEILSFPSLTDIGGVLILNDNYLLHSINGFPNLRTVDQIYMLGSFSSVSFPALVRVSDGADVSGFITDTSVCDYIYQLGASGVIKGFTSCRIDKPGEDWEGDGLLMPRSMIGVTIGVSVVFILVVTGITRFFYVRKRRQKKGAAVSEPAYSVGMNILADTEHSREDNATADSARNKSALIVRTSSIGSQS